MNKYTVAFRMPCGKSHIIDIETELGDMEGINIAKQEVTAWALTHYGKEPLVMMCNVI